MKEICTGKTKSQSQRTRSAEIRLSIYSLYFAEMKIAAQYYGSSTFQLLYLGCFFIQYFYWLKVQKFSFINPIFILGAYIFIYFESEVANLSVRKLRRWIQTLAILKFLKLYDYPDLLYYKDAKQNFKLLCRQICLLKTTEIVADFCT